MWSKKERIEPQEVAKKKRFRIQDMYENDESNLVQIDIHYQENQCRTVYEEKPLHRSKPMIIYASGIIIITTNYILTVNHKK